MEGNEERRAIKFKQNLCKLCIMWDNNCKCSIYGCRHAVR